MMSTEITHRRVYRLGKLTQILATRWMTMGDSGSFFDDYCEMVKNNCSGDRNQLFQRQLRYAEGTDSARQRDQGMQ